VNEQTFRAVAAFVGFLCVFVTLMAILYPLAKDLQADGRAFAARQAEREVRGGR
jgi:hypothetical protein